MFRRDLERRLEWVVEWLEDEDNQERIAFLLAEILDLVEEKKREL